MMDFQLISSAKRQSGAVLIISLILLLALTIIGITSSGVTGLEEKMAANTKDVNLAFQAAESALRYVETTVLKTKPSFDRTAVDASQGTKGIYTTLVNCKPSPPAAANDPYVCDSEHTTYPRDTSGSNPAFDPTKQPFYTKVDWEATTAAKYATYENAGSTSTSSTGTKLTGLYKPPVYIIEEIMSKPPTNNNDCYDIPPPPYCSNTAQTETWMRITAHGWGSNANSVATVQSIVKITYQ